MSIKEKAFKWWVEKTKQNDNAVLRKEIPD